ncbi:MAG: hypothetical protein HY902_17870 [Deltaproteobacteria bacterium]|nr:hypothetical protein [Deltaproteobacteria bacterium]
MKHNIFQWLIAAGVLSGTAACGSGAAITGLAPSDDIGADRAAATATVAADASKPAPTLPGPGPNAVAAGNSIVMHEWGTFTSVQGSDGSTQDGLQHEEEALPSFVYARDHLANNQKMAEGLPEPCNQKMETPVVYFYTAKAQKVTFSVTFANGIISQWFPAVTDMAPELGALKNPGQSNSHGLSGGSLTWQVQLDPTLDMAKAPQVPADSVWQPSRQTLATPLRFVGSDNEFNQVDQTERFLFYRGLGRFTLPVKVLTDADGAVRGRNDSDDNLPFAVLLKATADGQGGVQVLHAIGAHNSSQAVALKADLPLAQAAEQAKQALKNGLVASGLFDDEAQAMVDTWQKSWFATPGTRLLYILPPAWTEKLLPLEMTPAPIQRVRTLVGRIEALSPQDEEQARQAVISSKINGFDSLTGQLDRVLEPRLRRACAQLDPTVYAQHCSAMLEQAMQQN